MELVVPVLGAVFFVYFLALGFGALTRRIGLPSLVGEILAGIVIANAAFGAFDLQTWLGLSTSTSQGTINRDALGALSDIGVVFLAFAVGLEVLPTAVRKIARSAASIAILGTTIPFLLGFLLLVALDGTGAWATALFVGIALMVTSLTVTARFLRERNLLNTDEAHLLLGSALFEDVIGTAALTVALAITAEQLHEPGDLVYQIGVVVGGAVAFVLFLIYAAPRLVRRYAPAHGPNAPPNPPEHRTTVFVIAILFCLGASTLASSFELASIIGALLAGMAMSELRERYDLREGFGALNTFFVPFFFASIGLLVSVNELAAVWPLATALIVLAVAGKLAPVPIERRRHGREVAWRVSAGLVPRAEVAIIVALTAFGAGLITGDIYAAIVVMAIATAVIGPVLLHYLYPRTPAAAPEAAAEPEATGV